ncbi:AAA family ATPase [Sulfitobacter sp. F26204]|uniref:AAA family ATPase n=1 Tax=Sulfitobacter sp. F26204 TaxID=2996014 RepID=UPI00225DF327|nr:AAA family ATPase [Sulfitobacter sp. F26204]MCX7560229.1 AAA family ATPase [Sulfitobacter sp. F26204]
MPHLTKKTPTWAAFADTLIERLRRHHGLAPARFLNDEDEEPSELDILFQKLEGPVPATQFTERADISSRYLPARQLLTGIRLAATFGSQDQEQESAQCGAITVIRDIAIEDLQLIKDTMKSAFPTRWLIIEPDVAEGAFAKNAQSRFNRLLVDSVDKIEPVIILQPDGITLPAHLKAVAPTTLAFSYVTHDVLLKFLTCGHLADQLAGAGNVRAALPTETAMKALGAVDICAATRAPALHQAVERLRRMTHRHAKENGPRLEDITGDNTALTAARRIVADLLDWQAGKAAWHELSHSLLLYDAPGTGKTWLARAMGNSAGLTVVTGSFGEWQAAGHLGDMLREMRATFAKARRNAPCILVIDEIDAVGSRTDDDRHASHYRIQVITAFLAEMDQIAQREGVVVVGTCNHVDRMDPAVLRSGRMDVKIEVPLPDAEALYAILSHDLSKDIADHELQKLAHRAVGHSAADIDAAIRAARSNARHERKLLHVAMLEEQLKIGSAKENPNRTWRIAVHEAGHAVIGKALDLGPIDRIMITGDGGQIHRRAQSSESRLCDIEDEIVYSLGGRAAERLMLGEVSAGAGGPATSDLALATRHAVDIEAAYGLGHEGPVWHANPDALHLATPAIRDRVRQRIMKAEKRPGEILRQHQQVLEALASELVEKRSLRSSEIAQLLQRVTENTATPSPENAQP